MHTAKLFAALLIPIGLCNCAAVPINHASMPAMAPAALEPEADPRFSEGLAVFRAEDDSSWVWAEDEYHDWVLLGVTLQESGRDKNVWFVRLSTSVADNVDSKVERFAVPAQLGPIKRGEKIAAPATRVRIESFDRRGKRLDSSRRTVPGGPMDERGLEALGRVLAEGTQHDGASGGDGSSAHDLAKLAISIKEIGRCSALRPIRTEARKSIIREPNILLLILNAFRINIRADFANAEALETPWLQLPEVVASPQYIASSPLYLAGQHVVNCQVVLGPLTGPLTLTAGLVGIEMSHPDRPQNKLTVRILATMPQSEVARLPES